MGALVVKRSFACLLRTIAATGQFLRIPTVTPTPTGCECEFVRCGVTVSSRCGPLLPWAPWSSHCPLRAFCGPLLQRANSSVFDRYSDAYGLRVRVCALRGDSKWPLWTSAAMGAMGVTLSSACLLRTIAATDHSDAYGLRVRVCALRGDSKWPLALRCALHYLPFADTCCPCSDHVGDAYFHALCEPLPSKMSLFCPVGIFLFLHLCSCASHSPAPLLTVVSTSSSSTPRVLILKRADTMFSCALRAAGLCEDLRNNLVCAAGCGAL